MRKRLRQLLVAAAALLALGLVGAAGTGWYWLHASLPELQGQALVQGLTQSGSIGSDSLGVPNIAVASREDAFRALGYLGARDRLFQMDLLRRLTAGRLAQIFGPDLLETDKRQRTFGFSAVARAVVARLPPEQRAVLEAYTQGVNSFLARAEPLPFEFRLLGYAPQAWRAEDSVLIALGMFQDLSDREAEERSRSVLKECVSPRNFGFFVADQDRYTRAVLGASSEPPAIPERELRALLARSQQPSSPFETALAPRAGEAPKGSNGWVVAGAKTTDGRALLANDMHLDLGVPNVWYRATLRYAGRTVTGVALPGVPAIVAGSNGDVAWGLTSLEGDVFDLVPLELDPARPDQYRTPDGWARFESTSEAIEIRGEADARVTIRRTIWGPVAERPLLGRSVAIRWTALDPAAVDFRLLELDRARTLDDALAVVQGAGSPPMNVLLADRHGRVGWTITGRVPRRRGFDGSVAVPWDNGKAWDGYLGPDALPRTLDPVDGFIVNANQRVAAGPDAPVLGHDFGNGYRAYRISERLRAMSKVTEADLFALQLDTRSEFFDFYRDVALRALGPASAGESSTWAEARAALQAWNGRADVSSAGFALLVHFRRQLADRIFTAFLSTCRELEPGFELTVGDIDTPVQRLLEQRPAELVPPPVVGWDEFVRVTLEQAAEVVQTKYGASSLRMAWGEANRVRVRHPLSDALPVIGHWLDMPEKPLPGCGFCVRMSAGTLGASERLVVAPGHERDGLFHMPAGQSGQPLSRHYSDQQAAWLEGRALPLLPGASVAELTLLRTPSSH
jgi:penicillin G amidase